MWSQYRNERGYQFYVSPALLIPTIEGSWQMSRITSIPQSTLACYMFYDGSNWCFYCLSKTKSLSMCCHLNGTDSNTHKKERAIIVWKHLLWFRNASSPYHTNIRTSRYTNWEFVPFKASLSRCPVFCRSKHIWRKSYSFWYVQYLKCV